MAEVAKSGGVLGFLKSAFVEEVPDRPSIVTTPPGTTLPGTTPPAISHVGSVGIGGTAPSPDQAVLAKLEAKLQAALPPVYAAFMEQYEGLRDVIPDEGMRFRAALKTSKATAEQLAAAIETLLETMETAQADFSKGYTENRSRALTLSQQKLTAYQQEVTKNEEMINALQARNAELVSATSSEQQVYATEVRRLEGIRGGFAAAHAQVVGRLNAQKAHVTSQKV